MAATATDNLSRVFGALADPTRRAILARLSRGDAGVQEIAKPFRMTLPAISKHLKVLEKARLIRRGKDKQWRPCQLEAAPLKDVSDWVGEYRQFWEESFDRLDEYLKEIQTQENKKGENDNGK
jgi:DNA-binding transcriptional ArsR family regulator